MNHFPVGMEQFGAADEEQWEIIKETIDTSDYYVLILGYRYGSVIAAGDDEGISFTEKEYRYAKEQSVPVLAFLPDEGSVQIDPKQIEDDDKRKKLELFKDSVKGSKLVDHWKNEDDLAAKVTAALYKQFDRAERPGWVRGGDSEKSLQTIVDFHERIKVLEEENRDLKSRIINRIPNLEITINCTETLEEAEDNFRGWNNHENREKPLYEETDDGLIIHMRRILKNSFYTNSLSMDDVPEYLKSYVSKEELEDYNENLPDEGDVKKYNYLNYRYRSVKENGVVLGINIVNSGNVKATDINVDIDAPETVIVKEKADAIDMASPERPKMAKNPIEEAKKKYEKQHPGLYPDEFALSPIERAMRGIDGLMSVEPSIPIAKLSPISSMLAKEVISGVSRTWDVSVEKHNVHAWVEDLLHTYEWNKGEFVIAPTQAGEYVLHISAICEEIVEPIEQNYKITVVDEGY